MPLRLELLDSQATANLLLLLEGIRTVADADQPPTDLLAEADSLTTQVLTDVYTLPHMIPSAFGTRGGVLVEQGKLDEGVQLLRAVTEETKDKEIQAVCACYLALAAAQQGDAEGSGKHLQTARALQPDCTFLDGTVRRIAQLPVTGATGPGVPAD